MRHFTDATAAQLELEEHYLDASYELILDDGRRIEVPDYDALVKTIAQLEAPSWRVRVHEGANENGTRALRRA